MKKLIAIAFLIVGITTNAQEQQKQADKEGLTQEQKDQLRLKRLTLELDLNPSQQKEMAVIIADQGAKFRSKKKERLENKAAEKKLTSDEKFAKANENLDDKIAMKARIKKILTAEQFEKYEIMKEKEIKKMKMKHKMKGKSKNLNNKTEKKVE